MTALVVAALAGAFGQDEHTRTATGAAAALAIRPPHAVRGGLPWPARIEIRAKEKIAAPQLVLGSGFVPGMQVNTIEPSPTSETSRPPVAHGRRALAFTYPTLEAGDTLTVDLQLQVNPTTVDEQDVSVALEGANKEPILSPATLQVLR